MHTCPAPGCDEKVPYSQLACGPHWYSIPQELRTDLWHAYRVHGQGSDEHIKAMDACIRFLEQQADPTAHDVTKRHPGMTDSGFGKSRR